MPTVTHKGLEPEDPEEDVQVKRGNNYLLLIGIDRYAHLGQLSNAVRDVRQFRELLLTKYQFQAEFVTELCDEAATYDAIEAAFRKLAREIIPEDNLLVYFSGHGHYSEWHKDGYWIPVDATYQKIRDYFSYTHLIAALKNIASRHTFVIADSCYSGAVLVTRTKKGVKNDPREKDPSRWILASGRNEVVPDGVAGGNSPFAEKLLEVLERYAGEGIPVLSLVDKVTTSVIHNFTQKPIGRPLHNTGDGGGQFIFHPKHNEILDWEEAEKKNSLQAYRLYLRTYPKGKYREAAHWAITCLTKTPFAYDKYLDQFPNGKYVTEAESKLLEAEIKKAWETAERKNSLSGYRFFIRQYPNSEFAPSARQRREALHKQAEEPSAWNIAKTTNTVESYQAYLVQYAEGIYRQEAELALERLREIQAQAQIESQIQPQPQEQTQPQSNALGNVEEDGPKPFYLRTWFTSLFMLLCVLGLSYYFWPPSYDSLMKRAEAEYTNGNRSEALATFELARETQYTDEVQGWIKRVEKEIDSIKDESTKPILGPQDQIPRPQLKKISGGTFQMGSKNGHSDETPVHSVTVSDFYIGVYEVSNEEYCAFLNAKNPNATDLSKWIELDGTYNKEKCRIQKSGSTYTVEAGYENHPVIFVSWHGADAYCKWGDYRLPTEAEWEYAAGGGSTGRTGYAGTSSSGSLKDFAVYGLDNETAGTARRASKRANQLGLYDMSGNVWEWCNDWYGNYASASQTDPPGPTSGSRRVSRGGGWSSDASVCRVAYRSFWHPSYLSAGLGFRVAGNP